MESAHNVSNRLLSRNMDVNTFDIEGLEGNEESGRENILENSWQSQTD